MTVAAIILAAGKSARIGMPKAFLKDNNNKTFVENIINAYRIIRCNEIIVVLNESVLQYSFKGDNNIFNQVIVITNHKPELGKFYSVLLGAKALSDVNFCFIQNVDNPVYEPSLLEQMINASGSSDYVVPSFNNKNGHPILINDKVINELKNESQTGFKLNEYLKSFTQKQLSVSVRSILYNINTEQDYYNYLQNEVTTT